MTGDLRRSISAWSPLDLVQELQATVGDQRRHKALLGISRYVEAAQSRRRASVACLQVMSKMVAGVKLQCALAFAAPPLAPTYLTWCPIVEPECKPNEPIHLVLGRNWCPTL
jgi:hypothetical protein